ncbi:ribosomal protein S12 methylthiotransferase accessory factor [Jatrophihabitans endophyticus]|uniref:Ribosomal protein S12 methylthiotransferase accessory factor n=1 Tax=Jatrophihabitans endophyticus TaxID=1206085 RepID=A0A1M5GL49_9ACTN|nr:YcaO-like family protein [Jatrophihabitans endophyticus]SHG04439.1 ribosomal protein S12 methylthiotransferase accessory factor [Jatrophihabitans endophyticus]
MTTDTAASPVTAARDHLVGPLALVVSEDVGIVHSVDDGVTRWDHPRAAPGFTALADTAPTLGVALSARPGGMAVDLAAARTAAVGEAVERYSASHAPESRLRLARPAELIAEVGADNVAGPDWSGAASEHPRVHWLPGHRLRADGPAQPAWVAAARALLVHLDADAPVLHPTSSGLACHDDPWQALAAGLAEVIERDAFMTTWLTRGPVTRIRSRLRWRTSRGAVMRFDRAVETYRLFLLPSPTGVPVVLAAAFGAPGQPGAAVGAAADLDLARACRRALVEAFQTFHWAMHMIADGVDAPARPGDCRDFDEHVAYYLPHERLGSFDFLHDPALPELDVDLDEPAPAAEPERTARTLIDRVAAAGHTAFAVDVTSPDVRAAGLWVVRATVPGFYPLHVGVDVFPVGTRLDPRAIVNRDPHPFP